MVTTTEERPAVDRDACAWPTIESVERTVQTARRVATDARQATEELAETTSAKVRQYPLTAIGVAAVAGIIVGGVVGLAYGVLARRRA